MLIFVIKIIIDVSRQISRGVQQLENSAAVFDIPLPRPHVRAKDQKKTRFTVKLQFYDTVKFRL